MATTDEATPLQALLALFGALDQAVTSTGDPEIEATVERYLPGTTKGNAGWYDELLGFLADRSHLAGRRVKAPPAAPNLSDALTVLQSHRAMMTDAESESLTPTQLSRMVYAIGALSHLPRSYPPDEFHQQFSQTLAVALPLPAYQAAAVTGPPSDDDLLALLRSEFRGPADFSHVMQDGAERRLIDSDVAAIPVCEAKAKWVRGHLCAVLTTEFKSQKVSLGDLKNVIDPLNWAKCLAFFCKMDKEPARSDGWSRVLEHVSTTCPIPGTPQMVTPLKYWKGDGTTGTSLRPTAWVDYALDDDPAPGEKGDGRIVVDEGFIRMTSTGTLSTERGVRVRTRKVVGFRNLGYVAAAPFACAMGYGNQGIDMLIGGVANRAKNPAGWTDWEPSTPTPSGSSQRPAQPGQPADNGDASRRAVALAVDMVNECIDDMSKKSAAMAAKWATGAVPVAETMTYTADLANRLATDPWRYLERLRGPGQGGDK